MDITPLHPEELKPEDHSVKKDHSELSSLYPHAKTFAELDAEQK